MLGEIGCKHSLAIIWGSKPPNPRLHKIEQLLNKGAKIDHFIPAVGEVDGYDWILSGHDTVFRRAVKLKNALDNAIGPYSKPNVVEMLVGQFPTYRKNAQGSWKSLLGRLFRHRLYTAAQILIKTHEPTNPLYDLVCCHNDPTDVFIWLPLIFEHYTPSTQIKLCLQKMSNDGAFQNYRPRRWLPVITNYLRRHSRYGLDFVTRAIGGTYSLDDPLCLRYNRFGRNLWIAQELRNMNLISSVNITRDEAGLILADNIPIMPSCPQLHDFLATQLLVQFPFSIELDKILGIGGESIVFRHPVDGIDRALKVAPYEEIANNEKQLVQQAQQKLRSRNGQLDLENAMCEINLDLVNKTAEFGITTLTHKNLIHYHNIIIDVVHGQFAYIIRKL